MAHVARTLGSAFVADVLEAANRQLWRAPLTAALIADWPGDPATAALAMRLNAALHAVARQGGSPALAALYRDLCGDFDGAIGAALAAHDQFIAEWVEHTPQTNEVGRAGALVAALMALREQADFPVELLELGSSTGLNLNLEQYAYDLGGYTAGNPGSTVRITPRWLGPPPAMVSVMASIRLASARGVDLNPLDPADAATRERLLSFVWADEPARGDRLERALALARAHPPRIDRADAADWLADRLREPQTAGQCRVVLHSMVLQYFAPATRAAVLSCIARAGEQASAERPFAWISFEWLPDRSEVQLRLTSWPGGETRILAKCHPYGHWIHWLGGAECGAGRSEDSLANTPPAAREAA